MWYIIAIEPYDFLKLEVEQDEVNFKFQGKDDGIAIFNVSEGDKQYSIEVYDDSYEPYYLNEIYKLNPAGFVCINHASVLLKWKDEAENLNCILREIINPKDKYAVFKISEILASNFLPVEYLNQQIKK
jgi:hypothetical protein